jgi:ribosomal protein S27AE
MFDENLMGKTVNRRSFLRGSALFAAALGVSVAGSAFAQEQQPKPKPEDEKKKSEDEKKDEKKKDDPAPGTDTETKIDADGREYRVCPQCGSNMYKQGRTWTCENCGYSYVE